MDLFNNFFRGKKVFVTGDTGFKGSWLCTWLVELGAEVRGFALAPKTPDDNFVKSQLNKVIRHTDGDVRDRDRLISEVEKFKPEIVLHLAAQSLVLPSYANPAETFETNILGTVNFFEAVRKTDSVRVALNITSDKCYQNNEWVWGYRESDPMGGHDPYSASKGCSELVTQSYQKSFFSSGQCLVASARAGNVIGGGDWAESRIIPDVFRAYFSGQELLIRNPQATRPWQFVLEPLFGYLKLTQTLHEKGRDYCGGWNFGPAPGKEHSVGEVIDQIKKGVPELKSRIANEGYKPHEASLLRLDISKALTRLNWRPLLNFEETIQFTIEGYQYEKAGTPLLDNRIKQIKNFAGKF
ncbi:MAG TPA: CDP-glucose 4,6-dehydratase [Cyclobacteriaceae bacterium]|nr:CDP-glucose 4,6-dehydratase [Cyclobacteriaceae bacterium]